MNWVGNTMKKGTLLRVLVAACILAGVVSAAAWARSGAEQRALPANDPDRHVIVFVTMTINGASVSGFLKQMTVESGIDPSKLSLTAGKPLKLPKELTPPSLTIVHALDDDLTLSKWH